MVGDWWNIPLSRGVRHILNQEALIQCQKTQYWQLVIRMLPFTGDTNEVVSAYSPFVEYLIPSQEDNLKIGAKVEFDAFILMF